MHIILGVLGTAATLMFAIAALKRSGVSFAGIDRYSPYRRAQPGSATGANLLCALREPLDLIAVLLVGIARCEGDISENHKTTIVDILVREFSLDEGVADDQLVAVAFMTRNECQLLDKLPVILANLSKRVSPEQRALLLLMMQQVASVDGEPSDRQRALIAETEKILNSCGPQTVAAAV